MAQSEVNSVANIISFRDLTDRVDITIGQTGDYIIGLSANGTIIIEKNDYNICMALLNITLQENGGCTLSCVNKDLPCYLNNSNDPLEGEVHLIDGSTIEMADKKLKFFNGPIPKRRRKLPQTPGTLIGAPPVKPNRKLKHHEAKSSNLEDSEEGTNYTRADIDQVLDTDNNDNVYDDDNVEADKRWLETSWCMLDLPESDQYMFKGLHTPEQISILAASYFSKQLRMFTDAIITQNFLDNIFRLFMDTITQCHETFMEYLSDISHALSKIPDASNTRPMHAPAVKFLTELLKQCWDPVERVVLILDLLRTFSHFDNNLNTMVRRKTNVMVLGSMSAHAQSLDVQRYGMDILAKLATVKPTMEKKAPVKEDGVDIIVRAVEFHSSDVQLARSSCRVLANLSSTLISVLNLALDSVSPTNDTSINDFINKYETLLEYMFKIGIPIVQSMMKKFVNDIGVNTEGRRFIFHYVKLPQTQLKKTKWISKIDIAAEQEIQAGEINPNDHFENSIETSVNMTNDESSNPKDGNESDNCTELTTSTEGSESTNVNEETNFKLSRRDKRELSKPSGILKKIGSYESLRTPERRLGFREGTVGGSDSESDTLTSVSDAECDGSLMFKCPTRTETDDDFNSNVVKHLVRKTIKRRSNIPDDDYNSSDSETEHEFLTSLDKESVSVVNDDNVDDSPESDSNETNPIRKYDYNDLSESQQSSVTAKQTVEAQEDLNTESSENVTDDYKNVPETHSDLEEEKSGNISDENMTDAKVANKPASRDNKRHVYTDVVYLGKLVRTQIITHIGSLVFRGEDSTVLMVIDKSIKILLEDAGAPASLIDYAGSQYGDDLTLMDLEPAIVISVIDAVRYRSVTTDLVQSAILNLTRNMCAELQKDTINTTMLFFKSFFSDPNLKTIITDDKFIKDFRTCFQRATERMEKCHTIEEIRQSLSSPSFIV
ncbi:hypothetical protein ACF0H5_015054 [Mactra antiquata]